MSSDQPVEQQNIIEEKETNMKEPVEGQAKEAPRRGRPPKPPAPKSDNPPTHMNLKDLKDIKINELIKMAKDLNVEGAAN